MVIQSLLIVGPMIIAGLTGIVLALVRCEDVVAPQNNAVRAEPADVEEQPPTGLIDRRRQRLESLGTLASGIAHDLNNLLTPILMSCRMLQRDQASVNRAALLETIEQAATRGASLIAQLLTFARGGKGERVDQDLAPVLHDLATILNRTIPEQIELEMDVPSNLPLVCADETEISQMVMNLAINARDSMSDGGTLRISAKTIRIAETKPCSFTRLPPGDYIRLSVTDTGCGISTEVKDRIFDPFFSTKSRGQGTGLGLSTSLGIIKSHQGGVEVDSILGEGTQVRVYLPISTNATQQISPIEFE